MKIEDLRALAREKQQREFLAKHCSRTEDSLILEALVKSLGTFELAMLVEELRRDA